MILKENRRYGYLKHAALFLWAFFTTAFAFAGRVDTVNIYSHAMKQNLKCVVVTPTVYDGQKTFPVVYLLHGYSGSYNNWIKRVPDITNYADEYQLIIVCPEGGYSSWYFDSPVDDSLRYETFIAREVPAFIDSRYKTIASREGRAITGLSMGGHGGLFLAWKYAGFFGAAGSMSGALDLEPYKAKYQMTDILGDTLNNKLYTDWSVVNMYKAKPAMPLSLIVDCGTADPFISSNRQLHTELINLNVEHDYIERNGGHNWAYWQNALPYQLLFFHRYFTNKEGSPST